MDPQRGPKLRLDIMTAEYTRLISLTPSRVLVPRQLPPNGPTDVFVRDKSAQIKHQRRGKVCLQGVSVKILSCFFFFFLAVSVTSTDCTFFRESLILHSAGGHSVMSGLKICRRDMRQRRKTNRRERERERIQTLKGASRFVSGFEDMLHFLSREMLFSAVQKHMC